MVNIEEGRVVLLTNCLRKKGNIQNVIISMCFLMICIGTQQMQTKKWDSGLIELCRDSLGVLMAIIIFTNYKWNNIKKHKVAYLIWGVLGFVLGAILSPWIIMQRPAYLWADTIIIVLGIYLIGFCLLNTFIRFVVESYRPKFFMPLFGIWLVMMVWMVFSRSDYLWPECYLVLFLCYYMTEQTQEQRRNVLKGTVNGIILGYMVIQAHALLCRPYDRSRYYGNFCNPNHNCMFLCICLAAILAKILLLTKEQAKKIWLVFYFLLASTCYSFIFMTGGRSGYLATFSMTIFFLIAYCKLKAKWIFVRTGMLMVALFIAIMPLTYLAARYIPTIHPHVVFYFQEGYSENRVHSWDPRDSEKFVSFEEMMNSVLGRFSTLQRAYDNLFGAVSAPEIVNDDYKMASNSGGITVSVLTAINTQNLENAENDLLVDDPDKIPALTAAESSNALVVRYTIYNWYWTHLSLRGMPYDEQGFQLTEDHWIQDTHNIYLDYGINFGWPAMILFAVFIWWGIGRLTVQGIKTGEVEKFVALLFVVVPPVFGMFEFAWGAGTISTAVFYLCFKEIICTGWRKEELIES